MSSVHIFPTEILECITGMVTTSEQMRLWQCGDRILNSKLKNGGLKRTSLCWSGSNWMPWPRWYFTTFDGIEDVEWGVGIISTMLCPTLDLNLLPKTLKRLYLACDDVFLLLRKQNVNMNDMLPLLHTLGLSGSRLCEENLKNLPSNLIELQVISYAVKLTSSRIFGDLPRFIQRLTLTFDIVDQSERENDLPSDLISLDIYGLGCNFNWFSKLPKSLKSLKMRNPRFKPAWHTLPQLEEMALVSTDPKFRIPKSILPQLPQSLKSLKLIRVHSDLTGKDEFTLLPKNLTRFELSKGFFRSSGLEQLPVNLTDIDACLPATHPDILSIFRPETIKMRLGSGPFSQQLNILPFPVNLQYLYIHYLNDVMCANLPSGLKTLIFNEGVITTKGVSVLPKSLTSLKTDFEVFENNQTLSHLGYISHLKLSVRSATASSHLTENWLSSLLTSSSQTLFNQDSSQRANSTDANHHLRSLKVQGCKDADHSKVPISIYVQKSFFDALANFKNLSELVIELFAGISSEWFGLIPQNVTSLTISYLSECPNATQLSSLPRGLKSLTLFLDPEIVPSRWDLKDEDLQSLPRSLMHFLTMEHSQT